MQVYMVMAVASAVGLIWRIKVAHAVAASCGTIGACSPPRALATGSLWGCAHVGHLLGVGPTHHLRAGTALSVSGLRGLRAPSTTCSAPTAISAVLAIVGVINIPIIHYSVEWWNSLHQTASVMKAWQAFQPLDMLVPLLMMFVGFSLLFARFCSFAFGGSC